MPLDINNLRAILRARALDRLEAGLRAGADHMCELLKATVSGPGAGDVRGPASVSPYLFVERSGRVRRRKQSEGANRYRDRAPGMVAGAGRASIGFQIKSKDYDKGEIVLRIGVDASAPGGTYIQTYLLAHDMGIRYPTRGPAKGLGPVIQRPWFRTTLHRYWSEFASITIAAARGL